MAPYTAVSHGRDLPEAKDVNRVKQRSFWIRAYDVLGVLIALLTGKQAVPQAKEQDTYSIFVNSTDFESCMLDVDHGVYFKNTNGEYAFANSAHAKFVGLSDVRDLIGKTDEDLEEVSESSHLFRQTYRERILRDHTGLPIGIAGCEVDKSAQLQALETALSATGDAIWTMHVESEELAFSAEFERVFDRHGIEPPETLDQWSLHVVDADRAYFLDVFDRCASGHSRYAECEFRVQTDNAFRWIRCVGAVADDGRYISGVCTDVTSLKMEMHLLTQGLNALSDVFVFAKDRGLRFTYVNKALADAIGLPVHKIIGKTDADLNDDRLAVSMFNHHDLRVLEGELINAMSGTLFVRPRLSIDETLTTPDGKTYILGTIKQALRMPDGSVQMLGVSTEISKLAELKAEFKSVLNIAQIHEASLDQLLDSVEDVIYFKDRDYKFTRVNSAMAQLAGFDSPEEMLGLTDEDCFDPRFVKSWRLDEQLVFETGKPLINKVCRNTSALTGSEHVRLVSKYPIKHNEEVIGIVGVGKDITDLPPIEQELDFESKAVCGLLDSIPQCVFIKDADLRFITCNSAFADRHGVDRTWIKGKSDFDLSDHEQAERYRHDDREILENVQPRLNFCERQTILGRDTQLLTTKIPLLDKTGVAVAILGMYEEYEKVGPAERIEMFESIEKARKAVTTTAASAVGSEPTGCLDGRPA